MEVITMSDEEKVKKRFIAGAICPRCKHLDTIVMYTKDQQQYRECVACGYEDKMHFQPQMRELETRVNAPDETVKKTETQVLQFQPPSKKESM